MLNEIFACHYTRFNNSSENCFLPSTFFGAYPVRGIFLDGRDSISPMKLYEYHVLGVVCTR